jgi:RimJ/RimL family protein N-acetyltransferase
MELRVTSELIQNLPVINITGERIALGPLRRDLIPTINRWRNDFYIDRTTGDLARGVTLEETEAWYDRAATSNEAYWFIIYEIDGWRPIGRTDLFEINWRDRTCIYGIMICEADARGKGYGTETTRLMLDYAFTALGLHNVMLDVSEYNLAGRRAYEKAGFREIGRRRESDLLNGRRYDLIMMDCLATEFESPVLGRIFAPDERR